MKNTYYTLSDKEKLRFQLKLTLTCIGVLIPIIILSFYLRLYLLPPVAIWIILSIIAPFFDVPSMIKSGKLKYQSLLLVSEEEKNNQIIIHGGTLFDYYFVFKSDVPEQRKNFILSEYLTGLLKLIDSNKQNIDTEVIGTTYILNERTANKIGFSAQKTDFAQQIILILNYPNLLISKSLADKKLSLPNIRHTKTYKTDIKTLIDNKEKIERINSAIKNSLA
ncbi:hypothetical protein [Marinigracilibium pacificum]|uniref:Uncharacterized protein n=1 Tax=Marinigracilibium pacificum TaxID=2729599 RepID=A0A848IZM2_9BACT|nr:hypothetical protein [Marinigracilibium pacificum]NMM47674.1 hypothetical protein [Marinigracilibium pacificum]